jgi:hypothetical protein
VTVSSSPPTDPASLDDVSRRLGALLQAAEAGDLSAWQPLPEGATVRHLQRVRPDAVPARDLVTLLGQPAVGHRLPPAPGAPVGVVVWVQYDEVTLLEVAAPELVTDPVDVLGPPEQTLDSGLGESLEQRWWPARGLILHVARATGRVARLYGHHASTLAQLRTSPLARVRIERHPR